MELIVEVVTSRAVVGTWPHTADPALGLEVESAGASLRLLLPAG